MILIESEVDGRSLVANLQKCAKLSFLFKLWWFVYQMSKPIIIIFNLINEFEKIILGIIKKKRYQNKKNIYFLQSWTFNSCKPYTASSLHWEVRINKNPDTSNWNI